MRTGTGGKGRTFNDRETAAKVRTLALNQVMEVLQGKRFKDDDSYHKALLLKMSSNLLPRLNEHTGESGKPLFLPSELMEKHGLTQGTEPNSKE